MLAYILAIAVALGSFSLYLAAFLLPEVHRKYDLVWSGVGLFYGLVLWVCAGRITGGVLLGQIASVSLIGWFGWQTLKLRFAETPTGTEQIGRDPTGTNAVKTGLPRSANFVPSSLSAEDTSTQVSLIDVVRSRLAQHRLRLRQNSETSSVLLNLDRLIEGTGTALNRLRIWMSALMSTAISETVESPQTPQTPQAPQTAPAPAVTVYPPEVAQINQPAANTVRIEVDSLSPQPAPAARQDVPQDDPELSAEWSDLEFDSDPDMETIDGSMDSIPEAFKRAQSRRAFDQIRKPEADR